MEIVIAVLSALLTALVSRYYLHMLQLESYQLDGYVRWMKKNHNRQSGALTIGVGATAAPLEEAGRERIRPLVEAYGAHFGVDVTPLLDDDYTRVVPASARPFANKYCWE